MSLPQRCDGRLGDPPGSWHRPGWLSPALRLFSEAHTKCQSPAVSKGMREPGSRAKAERPPATCPAASLPISLSSASFWTWRSVAVAHGTTRQSPSWAVPVLTLATWVLRTAGGRWAVCQENAVLESAPAPPRDTLDPRVPAEHLGWLCDLCHPSHPCPRRHFRPGARRPRVSPRERSSEEPARGLPREPPAACPHGALSATGLLFVWMGLGLSPKSSVGRPLQDSRLLSRGAPPQRRGPTGETAAGAAPRRGLRRFHARLRRHPSQVWSFRFPDERNPEEQR